MSRRPPPKIVVEKHENYRTIIQNGVFGGHRPGFFEWIVYSDELIGDEALSTIPPDPSKIYIKRTLQCRIMLTAIQAKEFLKWLSESINQYEKEFGKIITPKDLEEQGKKEKPPPEMIT